MGRGDSKANFFKGKYGTKREFPEGVGGSSQNPSVGGVLIFSGTYNTLVHYSWVTLLNDYELEISIMFTIVDEGAARVNYCAIEIASI